VDFNEILVSKYYRTMDVHLQYMDGSQSTERVVVNFGNMVISQMSVENLNGEISFQDLMLSRQRSEINILCCQQSKN